MSSQRKALLTPEQYLAIEREGESKSEYYKGEVFAFAGASLRHNRIVANVLANLYNQLRHSPCSVFPSDLRISIPLIPHYTYADIVIVCGPPQLDDSSNDNLLNPAAVIEVLSPSTERYDRGKKFESYQRIASLIEFVLVSQDVPRVEQYLRQQDFRWLYSETSIKGDIELTAISCKLSLDDIYDQVEF